MLRVFCWFRRNGTEVRLAGQQPLALTMVGLPFHGLAVKSPVVLNQLLQRHRVEIIDIHAGIQHPGHGTQDIMELAASVQMAVEHVAVGLGIEHGIMGQENVMNSVIDLQKIRHRFKITMQQRRILIGRIVIAPDQMLAAIEPGQNPAGHPAVVIADVAQKIDRIVLRNHRIPIGYQRLVHLVHRTKGPLIGHGLIAKMGISSIENHGFHAFSVFSDILSHSCSKRKQNMKKATLLSESRLFVRKAIWKYPESIIWIGHCRSCIHHCSRRSRRSH